MAKWASTAEHTNVLFSFITLLIHLRSDITSAVFLEPAIGVVQLCPGDTITFVCTVTQTVILLWRTSDVNNPSGELKVFTSTIKNENEYILGGFTLKQNSTTPLVSTATLNNYFHSQQNGTVLTCANTLLSNPTPSAMASATLTLKDPPSAPMSPGFFLESLNSALLFWMSPTDFLCVSSYTITLINITEGNISYIYNTTTNTTSKTVSDLTQGVEYTFTVAGVDAGGRLGQKSVSAELITVDTPERVTGIVINIQQNSISLTWMPPPPSSRPPVTGYKISHNTTSNVLVNQINGTEFNIEGLVPGVYLFTLLAFNVLGDGEEETVIGSINMISTDTSIAVPSTNASSITVPSTNALSIAVPSTNTSIAVPSTNAPSIAVPSTNAPSIAVPSSNALSIAVPSTNAPSIAVPSSNAPSIAVPSTNAPAETIASDLSMVYILAALGVIIIIVIIIALILSVLLVLSMRNRKGTKATEEVPVKAPFLGMTTFSQN